MSEAAMKVMERVQAADRAGALNLASAYLQQGERHPLILMLAAERLDEQGKAQQALALLQEALRQTEDEPELWRRYGIALAGQGLFDQARSALEEADELTPDQPMILMPLATACYRMGDLAEADARFAEVEALQPESAEPLAARAAIAVQRGDLHQGRTLAERALQRAPGQVTASIALARAALESGDAEQSEAAASRLLASLPPKSEERLSLYGLRADARDRLGRPGDAMIDYAMRNAELIRQFTPVIAASGLERQIDKVKRLKGYFDAADPQAWRDTPSPPASPCAAHLFIVGFPRSGTTLLEKALSGHDRIRTLPEIDCLAGAGLDMLESSDGLDRLASLSGNEQATRRDQYFSAAETAVGGLDGMVLVDKLPLQSIALPLIAKLFPDARIVLSIRDPRDVVLSGFRRRFQMNAAMFELLTVSGAAAFYDGVMSLVARYRETLPIDPLEIRHEDLVDRFKPEVTRVLHLVGLEWQDEILGFPGRAVENARTPSDYQLRKGLNREGIGSWRGYERALASIQPVLKPWVRRWNYPET